MTSKRVIHNQPMLSSECVFPCLRQCRAQTGGAYAQLHMDALRPDSALTPEQRAQLCSAVGATDDDSLAHDLGTVAQKPSPEDYEAATVLGQSQA